MYEKLIGSWVFGIIERIIIRYLIIGFLKTEIAS